MGFIRRLAADARGATAIEYGLIAAFMLLAIVLSVTTFAANAIAIWNDVGTRVASAMS